MDQLLFCTLNGTQVYETSLQTQVSQILLYHLISAQYCQEKQKNFT